ncbi:hypothetical protein BT69DRAFT_1306264 [Atractiella rhizophila]|nr:hypothetical protein BT69DRAFT_1306264 [Atractiella rhizophila]
MDKCKGTVTGRSVQLRNHLRSSDKATKQAKAVKFLFQPPNSVNAVYPSGSMPFHIYPQAILVGSISPPFPDLSYDRLRLPSLLEDVKPRLPTVSAAHIPYHLANAHGF